MATISVLVRRDLKRFVREKSRVVGALLQPLIFWIVIGSGMSPTFKLQSQPDVGYLEYFFPGVVVMVVLFSAIFATMSVIEDRHSGFLQAVLVAPGSRTSVVLGKCSGSALVAMLHGAVLLLLAPLAGFGFPDMQPLSLLLGLGLTCFALCATGFAVAWRLDSTAGYHVVMSLLLLPMWIVSGAMFPADEGSVMGTVVGANPLSYAVSAVRRGLYGEHLPAGLLPSAHGVLGEFIVLGGFALLSVTAAALLCERRR
jgi:daunorubicin resistance ABC transporter membrane protein